MLTARIRSDKGLYRVPSPDMKHKRDFETADRTEALWRALCWYIGDVIILVDGERVFARIGDTLVVYDQTPVACRLKRAYVPA